MAENILQQELNANGFSQADLSKASGVSTGTINRVCRQSRTVAPKTQGKLVKALNALTGKEYTVVDIFKSAY